MTPSSDEVAQSAFNTSFPEVSLSASSEHYVQQTETQQSIMNVPDWPFDWTSEDDFNLPAGDMGKRLASQLDEPELPSTLKRRCVDASPQWTMEAQPNLTTTTTSGDLQAQADLLGEGDLPASVWSDLDIDAAFTAMETPQKPSSGDSGSSATYTGGELMHESMTQVHPALEATTHQTPPSSVLRGLDADSRFGEEFDPELLHSPPEAGDNTTEASPQQSLPESVDWSAVHSHVSQLTKATSVSDTSPNPEGQAKHLKTSTQVYPPMDQPVRLSSFESMSLKQYKTFFRLHEMIDAKQQMYKSQPETIFELFARVIYSSRENFHHKQYFQFRDLFIDSPPFLSGALLN